ncbi:spore germination protein [Desmospora profundinema]|uniref:Spore germination protein KA n=1 Tax=Desmospora profundinema TaxID=1571184 RepID=A0ABU1IHX1_9BACL|nr:spore germination protein [Desmospora profundinema]MDR6224371.1 spore germination protein KA [Desmospora profundinema]
MAYKKTRKIRKKNQIPSTPNKNAKDVALYSSLSNNLRFIREAFSHSSDLVVRDILLGKQEKRKVAVVYLEGMADSSSIQNFIMKSLIHEEKTDGLIIDDWIENIEETVLSASHVDEVSDFAGLLDTVLEGNTAILIDGMDKALSVQTRGVETRNVVEPDSQTLIRGPREGLVESFSVNVSLIRRRIKSADLVLETRVLGKITKTKTGVMYLRGTANEKVLEEVRKRLDRIDIDGILESSYIEEYIQDDSFTPFPTIQSTERPDSVAAALLEGRVAILTEGTPFVLLVPALLIQFYQSPEDYYHRWDISTLIRVIRLMALFIAFLGPSMYIAITTYHPVMIPTPLLISLAGQREGIPFPALLEALIMEVTFEILREAGLRLPRVIGQAISIVGTVVVGEAAVRAGLASPAMVIVVAITAISSFAIPHYDMAISIRMLRFGMMALAASFGLYGIFVGLFALALHLTSLRSFGIPYTMPLAPFIGEDQKDTLFRFPRWGLLYRPRLMKQENLSRGRGRRVIRSR